MKRHRVAGNILIPMFAVMFSLVTLLPVGGAYAQPITDCSGCHGTSSSDWRPLDSSDGFRHMTSGSFKGNHSEHMGVTTTANVCAKCHGSTTNPVTGYTNAHRNGGIDMAANINNSPKTGGATYSKGVFFNQTSVPVTGTCSSVNCHFEAATPQWGSSNFSYTNSTTNDCNKCHGAAPTDGNHPYGSQKHGVYYGTDTGSCVKCHSDHTAETNKFAHATSAGNRGLVVAFNAAPNNGFGRYTGNVSYPNYLPSQNTGRAGTCQSLYCHSDGTAGNAPYAAPNQRPVWGNTLTCTGCHKSDIASGDNMVTGSHGKHVNGYGLAYNTIKCVTCHAVTATAGMTIANVSRHVNKSVDIAFDNTSSAANGSYNSQPATPSSPSTKVPGTAPGQCTNVYCHSTGQHSDGTPLVAADYKTPTWGTPSTGQCGTCHGVDSDQHSGQAIANVIASGSHPKHVIFTFGIPAPNAETRCAACHSTSPGLTQTGGCQSAVCHTNMATKHANYEINVGIPALFGDSATYNAASLTPGTGYSTCSNVYCHSNGLTTSPAYSTPTWGNAASGACGTCHGVTADAPPASPPHTKHVGSANLNPYRFACAKCHSGKVQTLADSNSAPAFTNTTTHVNTVRDVAFDATNPFGTYSSATQSCRNAYCHSTGNINVASASLPAAYGGTNYARQLWSGSVSCNSCHGRSTTSGTATYGMPDYTNAGSPGSATSNSHSKHVSSSAIKCVECHQKTTKTGTSIRSTSPSLHVNGTPDVFFNLSGLSASGTYNGAVGTKQCSNTYCHGTTSLKWGDTTYCNSCHSANDAASGGGGVNNWGSATPVSAHTLHVEESSLPSKYTNYSTGNLSSSTTTYRFGCASCHNPASASHVNGYASSPYRAEVFFGYTAPGKKPNYTYTGTAGTSDNGFGWSNGNTVCNQTYCHSNGAGGNGTTPVSWATTTNTAGAARCGLCHDKAGDASWSGTAPHLKHVTTYIANTNITCNSCHALTASSSSALSDKTKHVNKVKNVSFNAFANSAATYSLTTQQCQNVYCHGNGTTLTPTVTATWSGTTSCSSCHGNTSATLTTGSHVKHLASYSCDKCHALTAGSSTALKNAASYGYHVNGQINVAFEIGSSATSGATYGGVATPRAKTPDNGASYGSCTNIICHNNGVAIWSGGIGVGNTPVWGTTGGCNSCHGNQTYSDYRKAFPLYTSGTVSPRKPNAHVNHADTRTTPNLETQCDNCHSTVTASNTAIDGSTPANHANGAYNVVAGSTFRDGDTFGTSTTPVTVTLNYTNNGSPNTSTCSNVSCHPTGLGDANKAATSVAWNNKYQCSDCHKVDLINTAGYHHAMRSYSGSSAGYPTAVPQGDATTGTNSLSRRCTMCHVDHTTFSPLQNKNSNARANNLRTGIAVSPTATSGYTNSDFVGTAGGTGGICISCHTNELTKSPTRLLTETGSTKTVAIPLADYSSSSHEYAIASAMKSSDNGGTFQSNCSKCHNGRNGEGTTVFSSMTTATHDRSVRRIYASLGTNLTDGIDALFCYRCHSNATDAIGGTKKPVDGKDYYNKVTMSAAAEDTWTVFQKTYRHDVANSGYAGKHKPSPTDETLAYISANKHVSCNDCHDPHAARQGNHTVDASNRSVMAKVLKGVSGVAVTWNATNWTAPTYTASTAALPVATAEYQVCFKCHSGANTSVTTWGGSGAAAWTNLGLEFSPNNKSGHPVVVGLNSYTNAVTPKALTAAKMVSPWNVAANMGVQIMTCSDCHATDSTASKGPHGSAVKWMLTGTNKNWPYTTTAGNGTSTGTLATLSASTTFCSNCHVIAFGAPHTTGNHSNAACTVCHIRVPHGGKVSRLINAASTPTNLPARYWPNGNGGGTVGLSYFQKGSSYQESNCVSDNNSVRGGCSWHSSYSTTTSHESW